MKRDKGNQLVEYRDLLFCGGELMGTVSEQEHTPERIPVPHKRMSAEQVASPV